MFFNAEIVDHSFVLSNDVPSRFDENTRSIEERDKPRIGIIGVGRWGQVLADKISSLDLFKLDSVFDSQPTGYDRAEMCSSIEEMLHHRDVEAVIISTPADTHATLAKMAIAAGKHVLVSKPLAIFEADCIELRNLALARSKIMLVGHTTLFSEGIEKLKVLLTNETIFHIESVRKGVGRFQRYNSVVHDLAIHDIANILYLTDSEIVASANVFSSFGRCSKAASDMALRLKSGTKAIVRSGWMGPYTARYTRIYCDGRIFELDELRCSIDVYSCTSGFNVYKEDFRSALIEKIEFPGSDSLARELAFFAHCIRTSEHPVQNNEIAIAAVRAIESCRVFS
jgi:predicted dehydrogenase